MEMVMPVAWWIWLVLGLMLIAGEILMPSDFFLFFFGVGALTASVTTALGLTQGVVSQSVVFVAVSIVTLMTLRGWLRSLVHKDAPHREVDSLVGEICTTVNEIPAHGIGKVILRGSPWNARNTSVDAIAKATRVRVEKVEGITLIVRELGPVDMIEDLA